MEESRKDEVSLDNLQSSINIVNDDIRRLELEKEDLLTRRNNLIDKVDKNESANYNQVLEQINEQIIKISKEIDNQKKELDELHSNKKNDIFTKLLEEDDEIEELEYLSEEEKQLPSVIEGEKQLPSVVEEEKQLPSVIEEEKQLPSVVEEEKQLPAVIEEEKQLPSVVEEEKQLPAVIEEEKQLPSVIPEKTAEVSNKKNLKCWLKNQVKLAPWFIGGVAVGLGVATVAPILPVAVISGSRIVYSTGKLVNKIWSKKLKGPTPIDKKITNFKEKLEEKLGGKDSKIVKCLSKINQFLKNPKTQKFLNGFAVGYIAGYNMDLHDKMFGKNDTNLQPSQPIDNTDNGNSDPIPDEPIKDDHITDVGDFIETPKPKPSIDNLDIKHLDLSNLKNIAKATANDATSGKYVKIGSSFECYNDVSLDGFRIGDKLLSYKETIKGIKSGTLDPAKIAVRIKDNTTGVYNGWSTLKNIMKAGLDNPKNIVEKVGKSI